MHGGGERGETTAGGRSRLLVAGAIAGGVGAVALVATWVERAPIVAHFVDSRLAAAGVPASYRIAAIGPVAQRLEAVRIGDPAHPDLTARVLELRLGYGSGGPYLAAVRAQGVRLSARVADGRLSLGALDRLLPRTSSARPLALPAIAVDVRDAAVRLDTPAGIIAATVAGTGRLDDGFRGELTADAPHLMVSGCAAAGVRARLAVRIAARRPAIAGPLALHRLACAGGVRTGAGSAALDLRFAPTLDRWTGTIAPHGFAGRAPPLAFGALDGRVAAAGDRTRAEGSVALTADGVAAATMGGARSARLAGRFRVVPGAAGLIYAGDVLLGGVRAAADLRGRIAAAGDALSATPIAPVARAAASAATGLLREADVTATVALTAGGPAGTAATVRRLALAGRSGGRVTVAEGGGIGWSVRDRGWRMDGRISARGGGLPAIDLRVVQPRAGAAVSGVATIAPYAAGGARLALEPVRFSQGADGATRIATAATIDGPVGSGRIEGLALPIAARVGRGGWAVNPACADVRVRRLAIAGATIGPGRVRACGIGGAPVLSGGAGRALRAGVAIADLRLAGRSGAAPLALAADAVRVDAAGLAARGVKVRLGAGEAVTRLDAGSIDGRFAAGAVAGRFAETAGAIARVPLVLSAAAGTWRVAGGVLALDGALAVEDQAVPARFRPLAARDVALRLANGQVVASGTLAEPRTGVAIAAVAIHHDLATARGGATLAVPGLAFNKRLQPDMLTPATLGVVANVAGTVTGSGRIDWTAERLTSSGDFATDRIDLAAAFGPVTGIAGRIHFSDLLGLSTPPHQHATVAGINPGVVVMDGAVDYQLLPAQRIAVEGARWPFAGGTLVLEPTVLAFGEDAERRMTLRLTGLDAAAFVQQLSLPNLAATGTFDGAMPMVFDARGGRIADGRIVARPPGGTLAYLGALSNEQVGTMGRIAFDALKAIRYSSLSIGLDGRLDGEIVSHVSFQGVRQATPDAGRIARLIQNLPFRFNIAVRAPFRALVGTARAYADPSLLLSGGNTAPVQSPESEPVR